LLPEAAKAGKANLKAQRGGAVSFGAEALSLVSDAISMLVSSGKELATTLGVAAMLAAGCWGAASQYSRLWNLRFQTTRSHQLLCLCVAGWTMIFALVFISLKYTKQVADLFIEKWRVQLVADRTWGGETYDTAYYAVKNLGLEDFRTTLPPEQGGRIPLTHAQSITKFAEIYANAAVRHFQTTHPFLSKILWARSDIPIELIDREVNAFFQLHPSGTYRAEEAINIAATAIRGNLQPQTERIVPIARTILVALFLLIQFIPFSIIGYAAYKDLKVTT
jgi:hypothetical protein